MPSIKTMQWASTVSTNPVTVDALQESIEKIQESLKDRKPTILFVFVSPHHNHAYEAISTTLRERIEPELLFGCTGGAIIGGGQEIERAPAISLTAAFLPGTEVKTFRFTSDTLPDLDSGPGHWTTVVGFKPDDHPQFILLSDPFSFRTDDMLRGLDFAFPDSPKVGGLTSGASGPGQNVIFCGEEIYRDGAVGLALSGELQLEPLVTQGCRPIGEPYSITRCEKNVLLELDGRKPLELLSELYERSENRDRKLIRTSLFLGMVMNPFRKEAPRPGDFLIRNLIGADPKKGSLAIGSMLRKGQQVQFHLRDAAAAAHDLTQVLREYTTRILKEGQGDAVPQPPAGALLFSCLGRGKHMYGRTGHDSTVFKELLGDIPLGGFFCGGEIGPVDETTYLHGFTSCFGVFRAKQYSS